MPGDALIRSEIFKNQTAETILIQPVDEHDLSLIEKQMQWIDELTDGQEYCLLAYEVDDWNRDLSPWEAPPVFGKVPFGGKAGQTLDKIQEDIRQRFGNLSDSPKRFIIGGYSLAGLFALWASYQCNDFCGVAAASPSVWFPGFTDYAIKNDIRTDCVYLSLGDQEEKTKNTTMRTVGDAMQKIYGHMKERQTDCIFEWNEGNHFRDSDLRTAKAFAWVMKNR